jgi:hypothetical protein
MKKRLDISSFGKWIMSSSTHDEHRASLEHDEHRATIHKLCLARAIFAQLQSVRIADSRGVSFCEKRGMDDEEGDDDNDKLGALVHFVSRSHPVSFENAVRRGAGRGRTSGPPVSPAAGPALTHVVMPKTLLALEESPLALGKTPLALPDGMVRGTGLASPVKSSASFEISTLAMDQNSQNAYDGIDADDGGRETLTFLEQSNSNSSNIKGIRVVYFAPLPLP